MYEAGHAKLNGLSMPEFMKFNDNVYEIKPENVKDFVWRGKTVLYFTSRKSAHPDFISVD